MCVYVCVCVCVCVCMSLSLCVCVCVQSFNEYFAVNHSRLLSLWRSVVTFRRQFTELKSTTDGDLVTLRAEMTQMSRDMNSACLKLRAQMHSNQLTHEVSFSDHSFTKYC